MGDAIVTPRAAAEPQALTGEQVAAEPVSQRDIVVIGASAGGVEALTTLFGGLPQELPAAVFVVLHVMPGGSSVLPQILQRAGSLPVSAAVDGEAIERGRAYVAPPDHHTLIFDGEVRLTNGPRENGHRPAIDPLFRSAARAHGRRVIGAVLSGSLDDGAAGLRMISDAGGLALVQDPASALYQGMPLAALNHTPAARPVPIAQLARAIRSAVGEPLKDASDDDGATQLDESADVDVDAADANADRVEEQAAVPRSLLTSIGREPGTLGDAPRSAD